MTEAHFNRVKALLDNSKGTVAMGGLNDPAARKIDLTVVRDVPLDDSLMESEIFGPVLPIVTCETKEEAVRIINKGKAPPSFASPLWCLVLIF